MNHDYSDNAIIQESDGNLLRNEYAGIFSSTDTDMLASRLLWPKLIRYLFGILTLP